jgi:hypothetical protein
MVGRDVEMFARALELALFVGTLAIFYALARTLTQSWLAAGTATLTLGLFPPLRGFRDRWARDGIANVPGDRDQCTHCLRHPA